MKWRVNIYVFVIVLWHEERKATDDRIKKLKLHAKAKVTSLNRQLEKLKAQGEIALPTGSQSEEQLSRVLDITHIF